MYVCKNCGLRYQTDEAVVCVRCQAPRGMGNQFCPFCGNQMPPGGHICMNCGVDTMQYGMPTSNKSKVVAGLLAFLMGVLGVHNFYLGYVKKGVIQVVGYVLAMVLYIGGIMTTEISTDGTVIMLGMLVGIAGFFIAIAIGIWVLVEAIMLLSGKINKDGKGNLLKN